MKHSKLSNTELAYWQFSWEEMGTQDLPATLNHITNVTGNDSVSMIGHS
jgi:lysosomal acid lipase/cholesteryl ester hydrolase